MPKILYIHKFRIDWYNDTIINKIEVAQTKRVVANLNLASTTINTYWIIVFTCGKYRSYKEIPSVTSCLSLVQQVIQLAE